MVLLSGETALKVRKPVRFAFLDYSMLERRYAAAVEEVRVNETLAPGLYRGVRALVEREGQLTARPFGATAEAVGYAVEMRRFDERRTMAALCADEGLHAAQIDAVAHVLARFHATAARCDGGAQAFRARVRADVRELEALLGPLPMLSRYAEAALTRNAAQLDARAERGLCPRRPWRPARRARRPRAGPVDRRPHRVRPRLAPHGRRQRPGVPGDGSRGPRLPPGRATAARHLPARRRRPRRRRSGHRDRL